MAARKPHGVVAPSPSASSSSESESITASVVGLGVLPPGLFFWRRRLLRFIGEVAFGEEAESMAAHKPHGVVAPTPLPSSSSRSDLVLTCLLDLRFVVGFFPVRLVTRQSFFGGLSVVGVDESESSEFWSVKTFETLEFRFVTCDLFLGWGLLGRLLISFLFPCWDWWGMHLMLWLKQNSQTDEDEDCGLQEIFRRLHSMQAILTMRWEGDIQIFQ